MSSIRASHSAEHPAFSPVAPSRESCTSIFQPVGCMGLRRTVLAQMRRSFLARRLFNKTYALFNGPWNLFQPDGAIPLQKRIPRHHGITSRTQIASAMCDGKIRTPTSRTTYSRPIPHARTFRRPTLLRSRGNFSIFFRQECQRPISFSKHIEIRSTSFSLRTRQVGA